MKTPAILAAVLLFATTVAGAQQMWTNDLTGAVAPWPSMRPANAVSVPVDWYAAEGWRPFSLAQQAAWDAARAAEAAEAEAEAAAFNFPPPEVLVPVLDASGERTGTARLLVDADGQIVVVTDTASPQRTAAVQIAEFMAKRDAAAAKLNKAKAEANGQLQKRIENIEAILGIRE